MNSRSVSNPNHQTVSNPGSGTGVHYFCQENLAIRSCTRENVLFGNNHDDDHHQQQIYACPVAVGQMSTVDVEDLGRCFEDFQQNVNNQHGVFSQQNKVNGKIVRGVYKGVSVTRGQKINRDVISSGKRNDYRSIISPSEKTWVNIKEAIVFDKELKSDVVLPIDYFYDHVKESDYCPGFLSNDSSIKMADSPIIIDRNYSTKKIWHADNNNHHDYSSSDVNENGIKYLDGDFSSVDYQEIGNERLPRGNEIIQRRLPPPDNHHHHHHHHHHDRHTTRIQSYDQEQMKNYNFCTEEQWLRCPAPQCPTIDLNYNFQSHMQHKIDTIIPCMEKSSELKFYYGEDIGYLTPAEYIKYEEDSISNEKRKEKSRDAARYRRSKETNIFTELGKALPVPPEQAEHLDKASVMRLVISYLKIRTVIDAIPEPLAKPEPSPEMDGLYLKALDGFMIVLSSDGDMVYLSENVSEYLGVSQMDMMGQNVYDYSHPCDHDELRESLLMKPNSSLPSSSSSSPSSSSSSSSSSTSSVSYSSFNDDKQTCNLFLRLKCTLTSKGRKVNLKSASYKVIHCTGHMVITPRDLSTPSTESEDNDEGSEIVNEESEDNVKPEKGSGACLVMVGCPVPHPSNIEAPLGRFTFLSKHSLNMKFTYADEKLSEYLGWDTNELVGQSVFEFHHALDNLVLDKSFKSLFSKGQCETAPYRFLGKKGGYVWVVTQATLIHCAKQHKPLSVVCVNYILSGIECENEVYSARQLEARTVDAAASEDQILQSSGTNVAPVSVLATVAILKNNNKKKKNNSNKIVNEIGKIETEISSKSSNDIKNKESFIPLPVLERTRPLAVTASLFRTHEKAQREIFASKKVLDPQKELFSKPVTAAATVSSCSTGKILTIDNSSEVNFKKDNNLQTFGDRNVANSSTLQNKNEIIFQGKPVKYFTGEIQRVRPQVVTRSLFAPAPQLQEPPSRPPPQTATASIFAPRTEDMNKGFLTFSEDQPGLTMLKDEPEDLTHLAPTPGDVCVPLEDTPFLSDMLDDFILGNDNYCPLLSPGLPNELRASELGETLKDSEIEESLRGTEIPESLADSDPFMYRDSPSECSGSPNLLSPALSKSPGSIDSLCSPSGSGGGLSEDEMLMLSIGDVLADEELALRAPYIPMSDQDETLQLFISNDMVMWPQPPDKKSKWPSINENSESNVSSSLEQLLRINNSGGGVKKCNDHGGGLVDPNDAIGSIYKKNVLVKDENNTNWQSNRSDRSHKRLHCSTTNNNTNTTTSSSSSSSSSIFENDKSKRLKCSSNSNCNSNSSNELLVDARDLGNLNINNTKCNVGVGGVGGTTTTTRQGLTNITTLNNGSSQLLQQLMSHQSPAKNRSDHNKNGGTEGGGGGGAGPGGGSGCGNDNGNSNGTGSCRSEDSPATQQRQQQQHHQQQSNSVLMNLLVSGCDVRAGYICLTKQKTSKSNNTGIASQ